MNDPLETRKSWFVECQLSNAAQFLSEPSKYNPPKYGIGEYKFNLRRYELEKSMIELEMLALKIGCKSGFWRRLQRVAEDLDTQAKAGQYEREFHKALAARNA
ncbi:hypothetical protein [Kaarinaea lacus]